ncbi:putative nuclease HARBI1 [Ruditapes philippinarum]|uniref:putative nuclease HARBI1 n=1 Tax=Ruditapes philippinarum TaxID=129788 RepID=UPI00295BEACF|nr:putative nuclease HARBI1 [Ruditapes philippinarum]
MATVEAARQVRQRRAARLFRTRASLDHLRDSEILSRYRLTREGIYRLVDILRGNLEKVTKRSHSIPVLTQVLIGLRYLAKGDLLSEVSDLHGVSRSSACHIIDKFVEAVNDRLDNIRFPSGRYLIDVKQGFYQKCKIPNTVGAIDGTLIPIVTPSENEEVYVCRKGFHGINVQATVDHKVRFTDMVSKWPGSTHDSSIFENSSLKVHLERNQIGHLLGDSGYALKKHLLTPLLNPSNQMQSDYNKAHSSGRMVVERAFGMLKSRFRFV